MNYKIDKIKLSLKTDDHVRQDSVAQIYLPVTSNSNGEAIEGGLMDSRLGTIWPQKLCVTCNSTVYKCPGHRGHIELSEPILHLCFIKEIKYFLNITCNHCGFLLNKNDKIAKSIKICSHCSEKVMKLQFEAPYFFYNHSNKELILSRFIKNWIDKIDLKDMINHGIDILKEGVHPSILIRNTFQVPANRIRPTLFIDNGQKAQNDLTHKLCDIVKTNNKLVEAKASKTTFDLKPILSEWINLLQYHCSTFIDNELIHLPVSSHIGSNRPLKGIMQRIRGKEGRIRNNMAGKRVDYCGRATITPNPNIAIDEVIIPRFMANLITTSEYVSNHNIDKIRQSLINEEGWVTNLKPLTGFKIKVLKTNLDMVLEELVTGSIIQRTLSDGDYVIINRQPSLHKGSMMAHRVIVGEEKTIQINNLVCLPYNGDFDGDEMNLHVIQDPVANSEVYSLMNIKNNLIADKDGQTLLALVEDTLAGNYWLSTTPRIFSRSEVSTLLYSLDTQICKEVDVSKTTFTGIDILQLILKGVTVQWRANTGDLARLENGRLISGVLDKRALGVGSKIFDNIIKTKGEDYLYFYMTNLGKLGQNAISLRGLTSPLEEYEIPAKVKKLLVDKENHHYNKIKQILSSEGTSVEDSNRLINNILEKLKTDAMNILSTNLGLNHDNLSNTEIMNLSGSKGNFHNFLQIAGFIGQQKVNDNRIGWDQERGLSHYGSNNTSIESKGYIRNGFLKGLTPNDFWFMSMNTREGVININGKTKITGYMQRKLDRSLQELLVHNDFSVRDNNGYLIQYKYYGNLENHKLYSSKNKVNLDHLLDFEESDFTTTPDKLALSAIINPYVMSSNLKRDLVEYFYEKSINTTALTPKLMKGIQNYYNLPYGEPIGLVSGQSIGESLTQLSLHSLKVTDDAKLDLTTGLIRLIDLLNNSKSTNNVTILNLKETSIDTIVKIQKKLSTIYLGNLRHTIDYNNYIVTFDFDQIIDFMSDLSILDRIAFVKKKISIKIKPLANIIIKDHTLSLYLKSKNYSSLVNLLENITSKFILSGVIGLDQNIAIEKENRFQIYLIGPQLKTIVNNLPEDVELEYYSQNIHDIFEVGGIELVRYHISNELFSVLESQGLHVAKKHCDLIADQMTSSGIPLSTRRSGIIANKNLFARASFETMDKCISKAALTEEEDPLTGILENIILGKQPNLGTSKYRINL